MPGQQKVRTSRKSVDLPRSAAIKFDETTLTRHNFRLARGGIGGLYETSEVEIRLQLMSIWEGSLAAGCGGSMVSCEEVC
jgi:hypothetical protein